MPGSHDLSVENLRLHERIVDSEKQTKHHVIKTTTSAPTTTKHSARPPSKPSSVAKKSQAAFKAGSKREGSVRDKEVLVVTVIEEEEDENEEKLPPKAPSLASKFSAKKAGSAKPAKSKVSSHHGDHNTWDIYNIPKGIPPPPGFVKIPELASMSSPPVPEGRENQQMAVVKVSAASVVDAANEGKLVARRYPAPSRTSHHSKSSHHSKKSNKTKVVENTDAEFRDVVYEEVREVTRRRYVVKMPGDGIAEWKF